MSQTVHLHFELDGERYEFSVTAGKKQNLHGCIYHTICEKYPLHLAKACTLTIMRVVGTLLERFGLLLTR